MTREEARLLSPLQLAYVGDAAQSLMVRAMLISRNLPAGEMHERATAYVNASAQAERIRKLLPTLSPEENEIFLRGRNAHPHHPAPKAARPGDYNMATGFEAVLGYLYLTGQFDRAESLCLDERENACP